MFIDARTLPSGTEVRADICIVGAGPAGITLAREFIGTRTEVCLLESGGFELEGATQALAQAENIGFPYYDLQAIRSRVFGGSSDHWAGACRPLDQTDFESREWVPNSGWPLRRSQLDQYYARASVICELESNDFRLGTWEAPNSRALPFASPRVRTEVSQSSRPTHFGQRYRKEIGGARNIRVLLHANLVEIETTPGASEVDRLRAACLNGPQFTCRSAVYILAAGGIENARLLLASSRVHRAGLGNDHDLVGRYFMDHLVIAGAVFLPSRDDLVSVLYLPRARGPKAFLAPSPEAQKRERLLNFRTWIESTNSLEALRWTSPGIQAADELGEELRRGELTGDIADDVAQIIRDIDDVSLYAYRALLHPEEQMSAFHLTTHIEQEPNPNSRVTLSDARDALGVPRVKLAWEFGSLERYTFGRGMELLGEEVGRAGLGRVRVIPDNIRLTGWRFEKGTMGDTGWPPGLRGGFHHLGTTRMATDPRQGVVDANCRVHGIANLYVAGSSVFPTSGYTNPTLTIVALAVRLADHLKLVLD